MRVCEKHLKRAEDTLVSRMTGQEYDLCGECLLELYDILNEKLEGESDGRKRTVGRPKAVKK